MGSEPREPRDQAADELVEPHGPRCRDVGAHATGVVNDLLVHEAQRHPPRLDHLRVTLTIPAHVDQPHVIRAAVGLDHDAGVGVGGIDEPLTGRPCSTWY
jgi:hypothetical protein